jgi:isopropylmalate/homocitrate/citramalate synthase
MPTRVQFKFRDDTSTDDRQQLIEKLEQNGADRVEPVFPAESDAELKTVYSAVVREDRDLRRLLRMLKRRQEIEFAERAVERRLILPE